MAERSHHNRLKAIGRSSSTESTEYSLTMGRSVSKKKKKPKERWLLTRKTWRYMADAGRKLIPDGVQNRPEDIPKIEAYFQEVCKKEPKFLLWRKNSYPGALGFRKKRKDHHQQKGGSCRKACSADQVDLDVKLERPKNLTLVPSGSGKFDLQKLKYDFLNKPPSPVNYLPGVTQKENQEEQLLNMLEQYLNLTEKSKGIDFKYQDLIDRLQKHLNLVGHSSQTFPNYQPGSVHFQGDHVQKSLYETLNRYFSQSTNRDKIISDLLTDRKALEKLYFQLRKTKGFRGSRGGTGYQQSSSNYGNTSGSTDGGYHYKKFEFSSPPPLIEIESETPEIVYHDWATQTITIPENVLNEIEEKYKKSLEKQDEEERRENRPMIVRRRSSVDNDDVSQSVSDTIKRYLRMARKKSVDTDKVDRFKRVNYDRNLRNIKPKGEITKPGDDDGLNKGCQTEDDWILRYRDLKFDQYYDNDYDESRLSSSRSSIDHSIFYDNDNNNNTNKSSPTSPPSTTKSHSFLSHLLHGGKHDKSNSSAVTTTTTTSASGGGGGAGGGASSGTTNNTSGTSGISVVQKSKSSSSVMHHGSRLMAKKIFKSRSKSQTRPTQAACSWTPQGGCTWTNLTGRQVVLNDTQLVHLTEIERKVLQKVALAKLQALNLGVAVKVPSDTVSSAGAASKPKRRPYLLKRKAITTTIFDTNRKDSGDKDGSTGGLVFGIPLTQCVENDRLSRTNSGHNNNNNLNEEAVIGRHVTRSSFSSLIDNNTRVGDEGGSCENLLSRERIIGSVPGQLDTLSCSSTADLTTTTTPINSGLVHEEEASVPNILNECFRHLQQHGLHTLGIFRVSTSKKRIRQLREDFDCGKETTLDEDQCPHDVATLLKEYLRDLPDPLLCRELYHAFVQTQRIRNRRLQLEALQHLLQLLPPANRDTLYALLSFLSLVAKNAEDSTNESGDSITGNRMDSNNLATVFAPNILHCIKAGASKDITNDPRPEDRIDIINVVRTLIDHYQSLFTISADLLDEIYVHMMDSHPDILDQLLNKIDAIAAAADESVEEVDSESYSAPWSPTENHPVIEERKRTYSREECLHETAATGGPNISMRVRHRDKSNRRKRDESTNRRSRKDDGISSAINIISRIRGQKDDDYHYNKTRSSSIESTSSTHTDSDLNRIQARNLATSDERRKSSPYLLDDSGVITASLTIPVQPLNVDDDIPYIEDADSGRQQLTIGLVRNTSGIPAVPPRRRQRSISGSDSSISGLPPVTTQYDSAVGSSMTQSSTADVGTYSSPPSWGSTPPTSPDSHTSANYIPEDQLGSKVQKQIVQKTSPILQKVSFSSAQEIQQVRQKGQNTEIHKSFSATSFEPKFAPSITNIGGAVLRSKTEDFERITKTESKTKTTTTTTTTNSEKKKYTKRRYTDSRHPTRHIPDSESLESKNNQEIKEEKGATTQQTGPVYKRRELISSVPSK